MAQETHDMDRQQSLQVPSAYFLCDVFLYLDTLLDRKLFRVNEQRGPRTVQAGQDAQRAKRCIGAVRYLWRNAKTGSHDPAIQEMKDALVDSPRQQPEALEDEADEEAVGSDVGEELEEEDRESDPEVSEAEDGAEIPASQHSTLSAMTMIMGEVDSPDLGRHPYSESEPGDAESQLPPPLAAKASRVDGWVKEIVGSLGAVSKGKPLRLTLEMF